MQGAAQHLAREEKQQNLKTEQTGRVTRIGVVAVGVLPSALAVLEMVR